MVVGSGTYGVFHNNDGFLCAAVLHLENNISASVVPSRNSRCYMGNCTCQDHSLPVPAEQLVSFRRKSEMGNLSESALCSDRLVPCDPVFHKR